MIECPMFQCKTCNKDAKVTIQDECFDCIQLDPEKEAKLRQHFARFNEGGPLPDHDTFFEWLVAPTKSDCG